MRSLAFTAACDNCALLMSRGRFPFISARFDHAGLSSAELPCDAVDEQFRAPLTPTVFCFAGPGGPNVVFRHQS